MNTAFVKIWGEVAGAVAWDKSTGVASFEYSSEFKRLGWDLSPLKMPIQSPKTIFNFPELKPARNSPVDTFKGLPGLLADVLPDTYGNQLINSWLAQNGRAPGSMNPVELLCFIGTRGMGALEFEPAVLKDRKLPFAIELDSLVHTAKKLLTEKSSFQTNLKKEEEQALLEILKIF
jgi:serine/threonine-protein kinase HipA